MAWNEDLLKQLMAAFEVEAREHLQNASRLLVELEQLPEASANRAELIGEVFRLIHSLKGAARAVDQKDVERLSHRLESLIGKARSGQLTLTAVHYDLLLRSVDSLQQLVDAALAGRLPDPGWAALADELDSAMQDGGPTSPAPAQRVPPNPTPVRPEAPARPEAARTAPPRSEDETIRVTTPRIDELLAETGELLAVRLRIDQLFSELKDLAGAVDALTGAWLDRRPERPASGIAGESGSDEMHDFFQHHQRGLLSLTKRVQGLSRSMARDRARLAVVTKDLQEAVRHLRMVPVETLYHAVPRMVRDVSHALGKSAELSLLGGETNLDKRILEQLKDPVLHLVRNALDHGIEPPEERQAAGKPAAGRIQLSAQQQGSQLLLTIADDGAGIDLAALRQAARERGMATQAELEAMQREEILNLIFQPGFSTRETATELSGRGVGLDIVRRTVDRLHGRLAVETEPGQGTRITLTVPLAVTHAEGLLVRAGGQTLALPVAAIERVERVRQEAVQALGSGASVEVEGRPTAVIHLADLLGMPRTQRTAPRVPLVVLASAIGRVALLVDELVGQQEMVVKNLGAPLVRVRNVAGATILGNGQPVVVLNPADLVRTAARLGGRGGEQPLLTAEGVREDQGSGCILVVDDSITTRTLERTILESAGYRVQTAADGLEAWALLQSERFDLVVTDVEMPRLNGFDLARRIRADQRLGELPVILVTSKESREDKERGIEVGADAYIVKSSFDQDSLLGVVRQFL